MPETVLSGIVAFLLLAASSSRFRQQAGVRSLRHVRVVRSAAIVLLAVALVRAGTGVGGERWLRLLGGASIAALMVTLLLSARPSVALWPVRRLLRDRHQPRARDI